MINYDQFAEIYDMDMGRNIGATDIGFYLGYARTLSPVLELGCGTGRIMKPLIDHRVRVVGIDKSLKMLKKAQIKLADCDSAFYDLVCADISDFHLKDTFGLAICAFSTYSKLLTQAEQESFLSRVYDHLKPGSPLLLDMFRQEPSFHLMPDGVSVNDYTDRWHPQKNCWISRRKRIWKDVMPRVNEIDLEYALNYPGQGEEILHLKDYTRYSSQEELKTLLCLHGFEIVNVFSSYEKERIAENSEKMIFEARKPA